MRIQVVVASSHGATRGIAEVIADQLRLRGAEVRLEDAETAASPGDADAVVLGSAVHAGHWLEPARHWLMTHAAQLHSRPVWLFSSGPLGDHLERPSGVNVGQLLEQSGAREHRDFPGALHRADLGRMERMVVKVVHAPEGDFRDEAAERAWADDIARALGIVIVADA